MTRTREEFLAELAAEFPEVVSQIRPDESGLLHCEVAAFLRATESAMDAGLFWTAERHFQFVQRVLLDACPDLQNAIEVSYLEDLAFGELTAARYRAVKERMPKSLRAVLIGHRRDWA
jgi:hypothetical protein